MPGESQRPPEDRPDPTVYTTEAIERAAQAERDYTDGRIAYVLENIQGLNRALADERRFMNEVITRIDDRHKQFDDQAQRLQVASNEWRGALQDRERSTVSRAEWDGKNKALEEKFDQAAATQGALLAALSSEMREGFKILNDLIATMRGSKSARDDLRIWVLGVLSAASIVFGIIMTIIASR